MNTTTNTRGVSEAMLADALRTFHAAYAVARMGSPRRAGATAAALRAVLEAAPPAQPAERVPEGMALVPIPPANCRERLQREGKPYPRSSCAVCGKWAPKWRDCDVLLQAASIAAIPAAPAEEGDGKEGVR